MEEWKEYKIGDICRIKHGFAFKGIHFVDEPQRYVCVTPGNFALKGGFKNDKPKYYNGPIPEDYILQKDDLVVTMTDLSKNGDTLGYSALIPYDEHYTFLHNQRIGLIEDISTYIDKHFLYWVMRTYDYQRYIVGHCSGSTVKHTSPSGIGSYVFRCPDLKMQKEISSVLDNLDDKIEVNRRINDNLEQQAQALFKSWFVDFEPFRDQPFVESELGMIPEGWRVGTLGDYCKVFTGKKDVKQSLSKGLYPFFSCSPNHTYSNEYIYDGASIIIAGNGSYTGRTSFYFGKYDLYQRTYACTIKEGINEKRISFLYYMMKCLFEPVKMGGTRGSSIPYIVMNDIVLQKFVLEDSLVGKYSDFAYSIMKQIQKNNQESRRLAQLRDTLLPRLMSGELKVNEIENAI